jgi:hypothetical protein
MRADSATTMEEGLKDATSFRAAGFIPHFRSVVPSLSRLYTSFHRDVGLELRQKLENTVRYDREDYQCVRVKPLSTASGRTFRALVSFIHSERYDEPLAWLSKHSVHSSLLRIA